MAEVFAGFIIGFALSLAVAPMAAIALIRSNDRTGPGAAHRAAGHERHRAVGGAALQRRSSC